MIGGVLIGGRSSRMGTPKQDLRRNDGRTQLQHAIDCLAAHCEFVLISATGGAPATMQGCDVVHDNTAYQGPATGIARLLRKANQRDADAVLVLAVDLPMLQASDLEPLVAAWHERPSQIAVATFDQQFPEPLVTIYPADYVDQMTRIAAGQDRSIVRWLQREPHQMIPLRPAAGRDADTPQNWQSLNPSVDDERSKLDT